VASVVKAITEMYTPVSVLVVVRFERGKDPQFYPRGVSVFLDGPDNLDGHKFVSFLVLGLHHFAEGALTKKFRYLIYFPLAIEEYQGRTVY
jgi:hypothetical protein